MEQEEKNMIASGAVAVIIGIIIIIIRQLIFTEHSRRSVGLLCVGVVIILFGVGFAAIGLYHKFLKNDE